MKKLLTAGVALLSVATLAACSGKANQAVHQKHLNQQPLLLKFQKLSC